MDTGVSVAVGILLLALAQAGSASSATPPTADGAPAGAVAPTPSDPSEPVSPAVASAPAEPPPSAWDRARAAKGEEPEPDSMAGQLVRTVLALGGVIGLIYLLFKVGLGRLLQGGGLRAGRTVKVIERVPVDARHALIVVELADGTRLLVGASELGMSVLTKLEKPASSFQETLDKTRGDSAESS